jgi:hypothetical protein
MVQPASEGLPASNFYQKVRKSMEKRPPGGVVLGNKKSRPRITTIRESVAKPSVGTLKETSYVASRLSAKRSRSG